MLLRNVTELGNGMVEMEVLDLSTGFISRHIVRAEDVHETMRDLREAA